MILWYLTGVFKSNSQPLPPVVSVGGGGGGESAHNRDLREAKERNQRDRLDSDLRDEVSRVIHGGEVSARGVTHQNSTVAPLLFPLDRAGEPWLQSQIAELKAAQGLLNQELLQAQQAQLLTLNLIEMRHQTDEHNELVILLSI